MDGITVGNNLAAGELDRLAPSLSSLSSSSPDPLAVGPLVRDVLPGPGMVLLSSWSVGAGPLFFLLGETPGVVLVELSVLPVGAVVVVTRGEGQAKTGMPFSSSF
jgi:hypothetical protein